MESRGAEFPHVRLSKTIAALQIQYLDESEGHHAFIAQLSKGAELHICGDGFTPRTKKVESGGQLYFVFEQDIEDFGSVGDLFD
jgi:hypothetical protein